MAWHSGDVEVVAGAGAIVVSFPIVFQLLLLLLLVLAHL